MKTTSRVIAFLILIIIAGLITVAVLGNQPIQALIAETLVGIFCIAILLSLNKIQMEDENAGIEDENGDVADDGQAEPVPVVAVVPTEEAPVVEPKEQRSGNLEEPAPVVEPEKETAHVSEPLVEVEETNQIIDPPFAPIPSKIPSTSRQLYGDVYSFCEQLPIKSMREVGDKMKTWGRRYVIFVSADGIKIQVDGAGSHYSVRIPQFGYFKTAEAV